MMEDDITRNPLTRAPQLQLGIVLVFLRRNLLSLKEYSDQKTYFAKVDQSAILDFAGGSMFRKEWLQQSKTYFAKIVQSGP